MIGDFKTWPIRKKVHYTAQCRFWEKHGWVYRHGNKLVPFSRWCKLIGSKETWAFEHDVCERYIVYGFVLGTGPCANLAYRLPNDDANHSSSVAKLNSTNP